jgi:hypothetical protein
MNVVSETHESDMHSRIGLRAEDSNGQQSVVPLKELDPIPLSEAPLCEQPARSPKHLLSLTLIPGARARKRPEGTQCFLVLDYQVQRARLPHSGRVDYDHSV